MRNMILIKNEVEITDIPKIVRENEVKDIVGTVLDPDFEKNGALLDLPDGIKAIQGIESSRYYTKVFIPPCPHSRQEGFIVIDDIAMKVNNLLRLFKLHVKGSESSLKKITSSFKRLQSTILGKITGKDGILSRDVLGTRISCSGRAVLVPRNGVEDFVALPAKMMTSLGITERELVVIGRDPVIWDGSIEVLHAISWDQDTIGLHPSWFKQMGADSDGDTVFVIKLSNSLDASIESYIYTKQRPENHPESDPYRPRPSWTISPKDILTNSPMITTYEKLSGKKVNDECLRIISGLSNSEVNAYRLLLNEVMLVQKVYMGPTGSVANKLKLMSNHHNFLIESSNYISERIQQSLFDHKAAVATSGNNRDIFDLLDLMNMRGKYSTINAERRTNHIDAINHADDHNLNKVKIAPIITWIYTGVHLYDMCSAVFYTLAQDGNQLKIDHIKNLIESLCHPDNALNHRNSSIIFNQIIEEIVTVVPYKKETFLQDYLNLKKRTLSELLDNPFYTLINETTKNLTTVFDCLDHIDFLIQHPEREVTITDQIFVAALGEQNANEKLDRENGATSWLLSNDSQTGITRECESITSSN